MYGDLSNNNIRIKKHDKCFEDENIFIVIDGIEEDKLNLSLIKFILEMI